MPTIILSKLAPYIISTALLVGSYLYIDNLQTKNKQLEEDKSNLKNKIEVQKKDYEEKLKVKEVVVKWKTKKVYIQQKHKKEINEKVTPDTKPSNFIPFK